MSKIVKTMGLLVAMTGAMSSYSAHAAAKQSADIKTDSYIQIKNSGEESNNVTSNELMILLTGLGVLGVVSCISKKINDFKQIPREEAHKLIEDSYILAKRTKKYSKNDLLIKLTDNEYQLNKLLYKAKKYDIVAAEACKFNLGAIKHAVEHNDIPEQDIVIKTQYLFDKAVFPQKYFEKLKKDYLANYPSVNFDRNYGCITTEKLGHYIHKSEPLIYDGLTSGVLFKELKIMEQNILNDGSYMPFYIHDRRELLTNINEAKSTLRRGMTVPPDLLYKINECYHTKFLKKTIKKAAL